MATTKRASLRGSNFETRMAQRKLSRYEVANFLDAFSGDGRFSTELFGLEARLERDREILDSLAKQASLPFGNRWVKYDPKTGRGAKYCDPDPLSGSREIMAHIMRGKSHVFDYLRSTKRFSKPWYIGELYAQNHLLSEQMKVRDFQAVDKQLQKYKVLILRYKERFLHPEAFERAERANCSRYQNGIGRGNSKKSENMNKRRKLVRKTLQKFPDDPGDNPKSAAIYVQKKCRSKLVHDVGLDTIIKDIRAIFTRKFLVA